MPLSLSSSYFGSFFSPLFLGHFCTAHALSLMHFHLFHIKHTNFTWHLSTSTFSWWRQGGEGVGEQRRREGDRRANDIAWRRRGSDDGGACFPATRRSYISACPHGTTSAALNSVTSHDALLFLKLTLQPRGTPSPLLHYLQRNDIPRRAVAGIVTSVKMTAVVVTTVNSNNKTPVTYSRRSWHRSIT